MLLVHNQGHVLQINKLVIYPSFVNYFCTMRVLHMRYHPGIRVAHSLVLSVSFCLSLFVILSFFPLAIVLSVLRLTAFDYPFGIFKLFLHPKPMFPQMVTNICIITIQYFTICGV